MNDEPQPSPQTPPPVEGETKQPLVKWKYLLVHQAIVIFSGFAFAGEAASLGGHVYAFPMIVGALPLLFLVRPAVAREMQLSSTILLSAMIGVPLAVMTAFVLRSFMQMMGVVAAIG